MALAGQLLVPKVEASRTNRELKLRGGGFGRPLFGPDTIRPVRALGPEPSSLVQWDVVDELTQQSSAAFGRAGCQGSSDIGCKTVNRGPQHRGTGIARRRGLRWLQLPTALARAASVPAGPATARTSRALTRLPTR
jgi:hypothetical protein